MPIIDVEIELEQIDTIDLINEIKSRGYTKTEIAELLCESMGVSIIEAEKIKDLINKL